MSRRPVTEERDGGRSWVDPELSEAEGLCPRCRMRGADCPVYSTIEELADVGGVEVLVGACRMFRPAIGRED